MVQGVFVQQLKQFRLKQFQKFGPLSRLQREFSRVRGAWSDFIYVLFL